MYIGQSFADIDGDGEKSPEDAYHTHPPALTVQVAVVHEEILPTQELGGLLKQNNGGIEASLCFE